MENGKMCSRKQPRLQPAYQHVPEQNFRMGFKGEAVSGDGFNLKNLCKPVVWADYLGI